MTRSKRLVAAVASLLVVSAVLLGFWAETYGAPASTVTFTTTGTVTVVKTFTVSETTTVLTYAGPEVLQCTATSYYEPDSSSYSTYYTTTTVGNETSTYLTGSGVSPGTVTQGESTYFSTTNATETAGYVTSGTQSSAFVEPSWTVTTCTYLG